MNEIKITFVGDSGSGKTCILRSLDGYKFDESCELRKSDNLAKCLVVNQSTYRLELRDTVGSERFEYERASLYKNTDIFFVCFAEDNPVSFRNVLVKWYPEIKKVTPKTPLCLICTKCDIKSKQIPSQELLDVKKKIRAVQLIYCSAKTGFNIKEMFEQAILNIFEHNVPKSPRASVLLTRFFLRSNSTT
ncbi:hypothetical protein Trydic_g13233 [Trypoxylus dichotomus]